MGRDVMMSWRTLATIAMLVSGLAPDNPSGVGPARARASLKSNLFNRSDLERIEQGYYEQLLAAGRRLDDLADVPALRLRRRDASWSVPLDDSPLVMRVDDLREVVLKRDDAVERSGVQWHTNAQGMRDADYTIEKSVGTFRIALVGDSIGAGWGVNVTDRFESILETLWDSRARRAGTGRVEVINCAVPGHSPGQRWQHFSQVGWPMNPDLVIYEATAADVGWDERRLRYLLARGLGWDSPLYRPALLRAQVAPLLSPDDYKRALRPLHWEILAGVYRAMVDDCRSRGVPLVWVLVPRVGRASDAALHAALAQIASDAGFSYIFDATDAYDGAQASELAIGPNDFHPNIHGHALLATRLDSAFAELPELVRLSSPCSAQADLGVSPARGAAPKGGTAKPGSGAALPGGSPQ
jgi:GDSL-like Lipase/Acylhydrolase family